MRGASVPHVGPGEHPFPTSGLRSIRSPRRACGASVPHAGPSEHPFPTSGLRSIRPSNSPRTPHAKLGSKFRKTEPKANASHLAP
jgi:hypothetical protein